LPKEGAEFLHRPLGQGPQLGREPDLTSAFAVRMEDGAAWQRDLEHLIEAERLGAELG